METPEWIYNRHDRTQGIARDLAKGLSTRIFVGVNSMLSIVHVDPHSAGEIHSHPEEQWGILLEGECVRIQNGSEAHVRAGDFWLTPANVPHGVRTGSAHAIILDVFSPPRAEYACQEDSSVDIGKPFPIGTATLSDADEGARVLPARIRPLVKGMTVHGRACTVSCPPGDNLWLHRAIYEAEPGDVLVVTTGGGREKGYWGELLARAALSRGVAGIVIDGCVRDTDALERLRYPVFATGHCARGTTKDTSLRGHTGRPVRIGQHWIRPGDLIVGDADGVVAVRAENVDAVITAARRRIAFEARVSRGLDDGGRTLELLGLVP